jgi:hypothetical protein
MADIDTMIEWLWEKLQQASAAHNPIVIHKADFAEALELWYKESAEEEIDYIEVKG